MTRRIGKLTAVVALAGALSLAAAATPSPDAVPPGNLTFSSSQSQTQSTPQSVTGGKGRINFAGSITTGDPCYTVSASHVESGSNITVTITATSTGGICAQVITHNNYTGRISQLAAGTYNLTIVHVVNGTSTTAFSGPVTVT